MDKHNRVHFCKFYHFLETIFFITFSHFAPHNPIFFEFGNLSKTFTVAVIYSETCLSLFTFQILYLLCTYLSFYFQVESFFSFNSTNIFDRFLF